MQKKLHTSGVTRRHIPALDGIRGLAILMVLADHLLWSNTQASPKHWVNLLLGLHAAGWIGVDLFFVLSGFLITGILVDTLPEKYFFRNFYVRRALRIFPLYYGTLFVLFAASRMSGAHWNVNALYYLSYTENLAAKGPPTDAWWVNIYHFWSLAVEEQFYLVWPFVVFLLRKRSLIAAVAIIGAVSSFLLRVYLLHSPLFAANQYILYSWTPARLDGLLTGALLAVLWRSRFRARLLTVSGPLLLMGTVVLILLYLRFPAYDATAEPSVAVYLPAVLAVSFGALLVRGLDSHSRLQPVFTHRTLQFFGRYSYGLYIFHACVGTLINPLRPELRSHLHSRAAAVLGEGAIAFCLTLLLAWVSFHFYESPWLRIKEKFASGRAQTSRPASAGVDSLQVQVNS